MSDVKTFPEPSQWTPRTTFEAMEAHPFNDTVFQNMEKEHVATDLLKGLQATGKGWEGRISRSAVLYPNQNPFDKALGSLIKEGYVTEKGDSLFINEKLKKVLVHTTHERATGIVDGPMAKEAAAVREALNKAPSTEKVAAAATKEGRAWYQFATHTLENDKAVFSTPRTAISGAILLGTGLAAHHFLKSDKPANWQETVQPAGDTAAVQR